MHEPKKLVVVTGTHRGFWRRRVFTGVTAPTDAVAWAQDKEQVTIMVTIG
jgi:hypothetical protein